MVATAVHERVNLVRPVRGFLSAFILSDSGEL